MTSKNNIHAGYKDSAVGIIPQEWKVDRLGEICLTFKSGTTITSQSIKESGLYPVYGGNGLRGYTDSYTHNGDYILIGRQGALCGNINFIRGKAYISEHAIAVQPNKSNSIEFLRYKLDFWNLNRFSESSAQPGLSVEKLVRYKLAVPPKEEQRKIAEILGVWDEAIEKQSRLIEKLELRKRALMQRLLTVRTRLSGFNTPWQKVKLGEIAQIKKGKSLTSNNVKSGLYPVIAGGKHSPYSHNDYTDENVITVSASGAYAGYVSYHPQKIWASDCSVVKEVNTKSNILFLYNLLLYKQVYIYSLQIGGAQPHVFPKDIERVKLLCPPLPEQKAIAEILTAADKEIATHRKKLDALRLQKRGLMQQLLTGKTRVKI